MKKKTILCKKCNSLMTTADKFCPCCGTKYNNKKKAPGILAAILVLFWLSIFMSCSSNEPVVTTTSDGTRVVNTSVKDNNSASSVNPSINSNTHKVYNIGETVANKSLEITVTKLEDYVEDNYFLGVSEGKKIIRFYMEVKNISGYDLSVFYPECYADDISCTYYIWGEDCFLGDNISTGRKAAGWIYYEVPEDCKNIEIEYETNYWTSEKIIIKLQ